MFKSKKFVCFIALFVLVVAALVVGVTGKVLSCEHTFNVYTSNGNATYFSDGTKTAKCDNGCGKKNTVEDSGSKLRLPKVGNLVASQTTDSVTLSWDKSEDATGYSIYIKNADDWELLVESTKDTECLVENLEPGTKYYFAVRTYKKSLKQIVRAEEMAAIYTSTVCHVVNNVTSISDSSAVKLSWDEVSGADGYNVYIKTDDGWETAGSYIKKTSFVVKNLEPAKMYTFAVRPYIKADTAVYSDYTQHDAHTATEAPETKIELLSKNKINLTFESVDGADGYQVYSKTDSGKYELHETYEEATSISISLEPDAYYTYAVRGYIKVGEEFIYGEYKPVSVHCGSDADRIVVDPSEGEWYLVLVNKTRELPQDYSVELDYIANGYRMDSRVAVYYNEMYDAAASDGIYLAPVSAYRSNEIQKEIFDETVESYMNVNGYTRQEAEEVTATEVLFPGTSEHNLGLAVDIGSVEGSFGNSTEYRWLAENAHKYGFIERYTEDKQEITGIIPEPWHWRYIGVEHATKIRESGLCLEEYLAKYNLIP